MTTRPYKCVRPSTKSWYTVSSMCGLTASVTMCTQSSSSRPSSTGAVTYTVPFSPHALGAGTDAALVSLLRSLDLRMGVMDLKVTDDGDVVWLEVNPQGQFLFCQALSGVDLIGAFAAFLIQEAQLPTTNTSPSS